jgi:hypothetical protein
VLDVLLVHTALFRRWMCECGGGLRGGATVLLRAGGAVCSVR